MKTRDGRGASLLGAALALGLSAAPSAAQEQPPTPEPERPGEATEAAAPDPMARLDFMAGEWVGDGWVELAPGRRSAFRSREVVTPRLGGRVVVVEGRHTADIPGRPEPVVVHEAFGVLSHDGEDYRFRAYQRDGREGSFDADVPEERVLVWGHDDPSRGRVRYTLRVTQDGAWNEVGESSDDGVAWRPFIELRLRRER